MEPFFSIVTPVYNGERFIKKCIESVLNQTYESWELILIDDGSTDASGRICDDFCYDPRVKVIHQKNAGAMFSRINGIRVARGVYELGLDADDYLDKKCLEIVKRAIDVSESDLILFGFRYVGSQKGYVRCSLRSQKVYSKREILGEVIEKTNHSLWNKAIRMDKLRQADYSDLKRKLSINLDYAQIIPILCNIDTAYVIDDILYNYRIYNNSISHSYKVQHIYDTEYVTKYVTQTLKKVSLLDSQIYDMILLSYLKMIGPRLSKLFDNKVMSKKDCRRIHRLRIYKKSKRMEQLRYYSRFDFLILKLFRYRQYWLLKLIVRLSKSYYLK